MVDPRFQRTLDAYFRTFNRGEEEAHLACFAEDAVFTGTLSGTGIPSREAIRTIHRTVRNKLRLLELHPQEAFQAQEEVAVYWTGEGLNAEETRVPLKGVIVFGFSPEGLIQRFRIYWDPKPLLGNMT